MLLLTDEKLHIINNLPPKTIAQVLGSSRSTSDTGHSIQYVK
jgi:hypothetical protein